MLPLLPPTAVLQMALLGAALLVSLLTLLQIKGLRRKFQDTFSKAYYGLDARMLVRAGLIAFLNH